MVRLWRRDTLDPEYVDDHRRKLHLAIIQDSVSHNEMPPDAYFTGGLRKMLILPDASLNSTKRWYSLIVLTLVYALNQADRFIMSTLTEPIKHDLNLSDAGIGFLSGVSLAIFYGIAGLWIAVLADRSNRRNIVVASLAIWSALTALSGVASNFTQLVLVRTGVGIGEAGGTAPSHSMVADLFPARSRPRALAIYGIGVSLGVAMASFGGRLSESIGWRHVFFILGVPGILLAVLIWFTVPEPRRGRLDSIKHSNKASLLDTLRYSFAQPFLRHQLWASFVYCLASWGFIWWLPAFLQRSHGMSTGEAGTFLGVLNGIGGTAGLIASVWLMRVLEKRDPAWVARVAAILVTTAMIPAVIALCVSSTLVTEICLWITIPIIYSLYGPTFALLQNATPVMMRTQISAISLLIINIANLVVAPLGVGWTSDLLATAYGTESLRIAMIPFTAVGFWGAYHYWISAKTLGAAMINAGTCDIAEPIAI
ncbi:MAG: transporter [Sphingomonadales bacterium]|nr:transporter [Sphingomonadales bacterium]